MERLAEIIRDGWEHLTRQVKVLILKRRISSLKKETRERYKAIGSAALEDCPQEIDGDDQGLGELRKERDSIRSRMEKSLAELKKSLNQKQENQEIVESRSFSFDTNLEDLTRERARLDANIARKEAEIKTGRPEHTAEEEHGDDSASGEESDSIGKLKDELEELKRRRRGIQDEIDTIHEEISSYRKQQQRFLEDVSRTRREEKRIRKEAEKVLQPVERQIDKALVELGKQLIDHRPGCQELEDHFAAYDLTHTTLEAAENSLKSEETLLELLDRNNVITFYALSAVSLVIVVGLIWLLIVIFFF